MFEELGGQRWENSTQHTVIHRAIDLTQEMAISVELRDDDIDSTLWEANFRSSTKIIVFQYTVWFMAEQRASINERRIMSKRLPIEITVHIGILIAERVFFQVIRSR